ncbi:MAG: hypothetical protein Kow009_13870 [Spirochaetales bacterium]
METVYITLGWAQSLDGRIATITGDSRWISSNATLKLAHRLRRDNDAILVGIGTVLKDDPELTCRLLRNCRNPVRVVLDTNLHLPSDSRIARTAREVRTVVFVGKNRYDPARRTERELQGLEIREAELDGRGRLDLFDVMEKLGDMGVRRLFVEGGSAVLTSFLQNRLFDRLIVVTAPLLLGKGIPAVGDLGVQVLSDALRPEQVRVRKMGSDIVWDLSFRRKGDHG